VAAAALAWFVRSQLAAHSFDWSLAAASLRRLHWEWLVISLVPIFGSYYGRALRWAVFLKPLKPHPSMRNLLAATVIGFSAITLFGRPGEFVRPYLIAIKEKVSIPSQLAAWFLERMFDLLMALLVFGFALTRLPAAAAHVGPKLAWVLAVGGRVVWVVSLAILLLLFGMRHFTEPLRKRLVSALRLLPERYFLKFEHLLGAFVQGIESTRSDGALLLVFLYSVVEWGLILACYWCLARAFQGIIDLTFVDVIIFLGFVSFGAIVQIPGIGGGVQVVAALVLTELFKVRLELATTFAVFTWIISFVVVVPAGLVWALKEGLDLRSLRRIGRETSL
jgi:uncharacterized protein (TIRG00374 family)